MFLDAEIRQAIEFESDSKHPVLSIYLNVDPHRRSAEKYKLALRSLLGKAKDVDPADVTGDEAHCRDGYCVNKDEVCTLNITNDPALMEKENPSESAQESSESSQYDVYCQCQKKKK